MTYCVGLLLDDGLVMLADTRTNAGFDNISCFSKLQKFHVPGDRLMVAMSAGNLAVTQAVLNMVQDGLPDPETGKVETIFTVSTMVAAAALVAEAVRRVYRTHGEAMKQQDVSFDCSILLGGQIAGRTLRLFHVYAAGNYIEATSDTPYLQIGEHKYGKPILDRAVTSRTSLVEGVKLALVSMDSTLRSNLSVGMPLDLLVYRNDSIDGVVEHRMLEGDAYFATIRRRWSEALADAAHRIPPPDWLAP